MMNAWDFFVRHFYSDHTSVWIKDAGMSKHLVVPVKDKEIFKG